MHPDCACGRTYTYNKHRLLQWSLPPLPFLKFVAVEKLLKNLCLLANRGYNNPSFVVIQKEHKIFWAFLSKIRTAVRRNSVGGNVPAVSVCCRIIATTCTANVFTRESSCCFQRVLAIAILAVCLSVRLSVTRVDQAKTVQARIIKSSPSGAWKTLVSGTVKLFP